MDLPLVTAESAEDQKDKFGFSILTSKLLAYTGEEFTMVVYLGRSWKSHPTWWLWKPNLEN